MWVDTWWPMIYWQLTTADIWPTPLLSHTTHALTDTLAWSLHCTAIPFLIASSLLCLYGPGRWTWHTHDGNWLPAAKAGRVMKWMKGKSVRDARDMNRVSLSHCAANIEPNLSNWFNYLQSTPMSKSILVSCCRWSGDKRTARGSSGWDRGHSKTDWSAPVAWRVWQSVINIFKAHHPPGNTQLMAMRAQQVSTLLRSWLSSLSMDVTAFAAGSALLSWHVYCIRWQALRNSYASYREAILTAPNGELAWLRVQRVVFQVHRAHGFDSQPGVWFWWSAVWEQHWLTQFSLPTYLWLNDILPLLSILMKRFGTVMTWR